MKNLIAVGSLMFSFVAFNAVAEGTHDYSQTQHDAQKEQVTRGLTFDKLDSNNDGVIEETEAVALDEKDFEDGIEVEFDELDENDDSTISRQEWQNHFAQM